ncbi:hypothetical protein AB5J52_35990 [Streptomyces sp. R39]|uniref:FAD-binding domain-containing protein n=1 Tax=Streptomyces sp. R39 TaxID=3238631 RepID=A0AB39R0K6_9ACTN
MADPWGNRHEFVWGQRRHPGVFWPGRRISGFVSDDFGLGYIVLGHIVLSLLAARPNVALLDETPVTGLRVAGSGPRARVIGVTARQNGTALAVSARTTVLATDGFAGNRALMREFCAELGDPFHGGFYQLAVNRT